MARKKSTQPTDTELEILTVLWERGPSPLGDVVATLQAMRDVANTTVATMLKVMLDKGLVTRAQTEGRRWIWSAAVSRDETRTRLVGRVLDAVFEGSARDLVAHLVSRERLSDDERDELRRLLDGDDA